MSLLSRFTKAKSSKANESGSELVESRDTQRIRYTRVLTGADSTCQSSAACKKAWKLLQQQMAVVPGGIVELNPQCLGISSGQGVLGESTTHVEPVDVPSFHVDQHAVSNSDYLAFVKAGGYQVMDFWPQEIWPNVVQFVDQSGEQGPRWWRDAHPGKDASQHPVVGISWYESAAFAAWAGKQLPSSAQWQRAATWHASHQGQSGGWKYPWGKTFEAERANTWSAKHGETVAVNKFANGSTPNGVFQLIGNVWEWTEDTFFYQGVDADEQPEWGELRGGAFDTYMPTQATCQFRSGQQKLWREHNVGFRCAVSVSELSHLPNDI